MNTGFFLRMIVPLLLCVCLLLARPLQAEDGAVPAQEQVTGRQLFEARCALCHQLPEPSMLNAGQWQRILHTMQKRMQQKNIPPLSGEEQVRLLDYLSSPEQP